MNTIDRPLDVRTWNVGPAFGKGARIPAGLWRVLRGADVVGLLECARYTKLLRTVLGAAWIVYRAHHPGTDRSSDVLVLIRRRGVTRPDLSTVGHTVRWTGPKASRPHAGRSWPVLDWTNLRIAIVHRTPGGPSGGTSPRVAGKNRPAWFTDLTVIRDLAENGPESLFIPGDHNGRFHELRREYREIGLITFHAPTKVDHAAGRGVNGDVPKLLGKAGSDHHAVRWPNLHPHHP